MSEDQVFDREGIAQKRSRKEQTYQELLYWRSGFQID